MLNNCHNNEVTRVCSEDKCNGIDIITYFSGGEKIARKVFDETGQLIVMAGCIPDGQVVEYYWTGALKNIFDYVNNRPHGENRTFYPGGRLWVAQHFSNGLLHGPSRTLYRNKTLWEDCTYKEGKLHGNYCSYHENGNPDITAHYKDGKLEGEYKRFSMNGMLYEASVFKEGEKDGVCTTYYEETGATDCIDTYQAGRVIVRAKFDQTGMFLYEKSEPIPEIEEEKEAELHMDKGLELLGIGCFRQALREFRQAIAVKHDFIEAYIKLALAYRHLGRYCDYKDTLKRVLEIRPDHSEACFSMAIAHIVTGNRIDAMSEQLTLQGLDEKYAKELMSILTV